MRSPPDAPALRLSETVDSKEAKTAEKPQPTYFDVRLADWRQRIETWWPTRRR